LDKPPLPPITPDPVGSEEVPGTVAEPPTEASSAPEVPVGSGSGGTEQPAAATGSSAERGNSSELTIGKKELHSLMLEMGTAASDEMLVEFLTELDLNGNGEVCWEEFKTWYNLSEKRVR